jgi:serine/threonine protein kinase
MKSADTKNEAPPQIGKFRIISKIGQGSMGTVYQAFDPYMKRNVAIKVADPKALSNDKIRRRLVELFFTEAQIYGMLDHRNILPVYDAGEAGDLYYLVMEYIENSRALQYYAGPLKDHESVSGTPIITVQSQPPVFSRTSRSPACSSSACSGSS